MLAIRADENAVMIESVLVATHPPLQRVRGEASREGHAVINSALDLSSLLIVIPGGKLEASN